MKNLPYLLALNHMPKVGPRTTMKLLARWPLLEACFNLSASQLIQAGVSAAVANQITQFDWNFIQQDLTFAQHPNHHLLTWEHPNYPALLKEIHDPPPVLYGIGDLDCLNQPTLAIIGTRNPSQMGRKIAHEWAKHLSLAGLTIVSGLARGIDTAAHEGCMQGTKKTMGILGTGVNLIYPYANRQLAQAMTHSGLLLSEFPLNFPPKAGHFPRRNRIISGLAIATLVIEATLKSGSLITARFAAEQNRDVFALPGSIHLPQTQGCHHLLKQGASLVTCYQDVLLELGLSPSSPPSTWQTTASSTPDRVLDCIGMDSTHVDTIMKNSGLELHQLIARLAELELDEKIVAVPGGYSRCS
jgi:DNA processing protein